MTRLAEPDFIRRILNVAQGDLSPGDAPFRRWSDEAGVHEEALTKTLRDLHEEGVIRRFGGVFDSRRMGWTTTLVGARVAEEKLEEALDHIKAHDGVTHAYIRSHEINVWFTLAVRSADEIDRVLDDIREKGLVEGIWSMPAKRRFKLKFRF